MAKEYIQVELEKGSEDDYSHSVLITWIENKKGIKTGNFVTLDDDPYPGKWLIKNTFKTLSKNELTRQRKKVFHSTKQ